MRATIYEFAYRKVPVTSPRQGRRALISTLPADTLIDFATAARSRLASTFSHLHRECQRARAGQDYRHRRKDVV